jgi:hypothetical protein
MGAPYAQHMPAWPCHYVVHPGMCLPRPPPQMANYLQPAMPRGAGGPGGGPRAPAPGQKYVRSEMRLWEPIRDWWRRLHTQCVQPGPPVPRDDAGATSGLQANKKERERAKKERKEAKKLAENPLQPLTEDPQPRPFLNNEERVETHAWIEERKAQFPTRDRITRKAEEAARIAEAGVSQRASMLVDKCLCEHMHDWCSCAHFHTSKRDARVSGFRKLSAAAAHKLVVIA